MGCGKAIAIYAGHPCYNYNEYTLVEKRHGPNNTKWRILKNYQTVKPSAAI